MQVSDRNAESLPTILIQGNMSTLWNGLRQKTFAETKLKPEDVSILYFERGDLYVFNRRRISIMAKEKKNIAMDEDEVLVEEPVLEGIPYSEWREQLKKEDWFDEDEIQKGIDKILSEG